MEVNGKRYTSKNILIAVGGRPFVPEIPGREYAITSDEALDLPERPKKIVIVGGGYIALEFASIFRALGSEVDVIIRQPKILRGFDHEVKPLSLEIVFFIIISNKSWKIKFCIIGSATSFFHYFIFFEIYVRNSKNWPFHTKVILKHDLISFSGFCSFICFTFLMYSIIFLISLNLR